MRRRWKAALTVLISVLVLALALSALSALFAPKRWGTNASSQETWRGFYDEPRSSIDVLYIGASTFGYSLMPTEFYQAYGFTSYNIVAPSMPYIIAELYLREALRYQQPKLLVLDNKLFSANYFDGNEPKFQHSLYAMRPSLDKLNVIRRIVAGSSEQTAGLYLIPLLRFHDRWTELNDEDIKYLTQPAHSFKKGWIVGVKSVAQTIPEYRLPTNEVDRAYAPEALESLNNILKLCEENSVQLLVAHLPNVGKTFNYKQINGSRELFAKMGIDYLELGEPSIMSEIGLDLKIDYHDMFHTNIYGAAKVTACVGDYIASHYDLPDRRGQAGYEQWDADVLDTRVAWLEATNDQPKKPPIKIYDLTSSVRLAWPALKYYDSVRVQRRYVGSDTVETLADGERIAEYTDASITAPCEYIVTFTVAGREDRPVSVTVAYDGKS